MTVLEALTILEAAVLECKKGKITYSSAMKVMERLHAKIDTASYTEIMSTMSVLTNILR